MILYLEIRSVVAMGDILVLEGTEVFAHLQDLFLKIRNVVEIVQINHFLTIKY